jgi:Nucleotide-diphospho-sugar transferase
MHLPPSDTFERWSTNWKMTTFSKAVMLEYVMAYGFHAVVSDVDVIWLQVTCDRR